MECNCFVIFIFQGKFPRCLFTLGIPLDKKISSTCTFKVSFQISPLSIIFILIPYMLIFKNIVKK